MKIKTWRDIMLLKMGKMEGVEFILFSLMSVAAWLLFANTSEDGEAMTNLISTLIGLFLVFFYTLAAVLIFDVIIRPRLCTSSAPVVSGSVSDAGGVKGDVSGTFSMSSMQGF